MNLESDDVYRPSGRVDWANFAPLALVALAIAGGLSLALAGLFLAGGYVFFYIPLAAAGLAAGVVWLAVDWGECRNPTVAVALAATMALVVIPGWYHCHMVMLTGLPNAHRVDRLPAFILWRLQNDEVRRAGPPNLGRGRADPLWNAFFLCLDVAVVLAATSGAAYHAARRPYCEHGGGWMQKQTAVFPAGVVEAMGRAFAIGDVGALRGFTPLNIAPSLPFDQLTVHYGRGREGGLSGYVYLQGDEYRDAYNGVPKKSAERWPMRRLTPYEVVAIATYFPHVLALAAARDRTDAPPAGRERLSHLRPPHFTLLSDPPAWDGAAVLIANAVTIGPYVLFVGALAIALATLAMDHALGKLIAGGSIAIALLSVFVVLPYAARPWLDGWRLGLIRDKLAARPDAVVDPRDPTACFVEFVPRENWNSLRLEDAADVGFVRLDGHWRLLCFEGDRARWRLPLDAIERCDVERVEKITSSTTDASDAQFVVVLVVRVGEQRHELPLRVMARRDVPTPNTALERSELFAARLRAMMPHEPTSPDLAWSADGSGRVPGPTGETR